MKCAPACIDGLFQPLDTLGQWLGMFGLRLLLGYEFWVAGQEKLHGENWFADIQDTFPFPFSVVPADINWFMATWTELTAPVLLVLGLGTRIASAALFMLTVVAWVSVHAGLGYNVCDNGFKLPLMYLLMFVPLILSGPGRLSIDHFIRRKYLG